MSTDRDTRLGTLLESWRKVHTGMSERGDTGAEKLANDIANLEEMLTRRASLADRS